jgi:YHS domain-containing protein
LVILFSNSLAHEAHKKTKEKVRCAYDGMQMYEKAMEGKWEYKKELLYFCTKEEMKKFKKKPEKYLKVKKLKDVKLVLNILEQKEYMAMMKQMGMEMKKMKMKKMPTHNISVYFVDKKGKNTKVDDVKIKITDPEKKTQTKKLKYNKMMKYYQVGFDLKISGRYKIKVCFKLKDKKVCTTLGYKL